MKKSQRLIQLQRYVNMKKNFTAQELADEFGISVRTVHRDMLELADLGVYYYTEQGRTGGYRLVSTRLLPPVNFTEDEALAIFFACQSLMFYHSLPFEMDTKTVLRKLYSNLPTETQETVDRMKSIFVLKNTLRDVTNFYLKELLEYCGSEKIIEYSYDSASGAKLYEVVPVCLYSNNGFWYVPSYDISANIIKHFRVDRILGIKDTNRNYLGENTFMEDCFDFNKITHPVRLYVELNRSGIRACKNSSFISNDIHIVKEGEEGFIDEEIDFKEIEFLGDFFMQLENDAKVIEPVEMKKYIVEKAMRIQHLYHKN